MEKTSAEAGKKLATKIKRSPGIDLQIGVKVGSAAVLKIPKVSLSIISDITRFIHKDEGSYLKIVSKTIVKEILLI